MSTPTEQEIEAADDVIHWLYRETIEGIESNSHNWTTQELQREHNRADTLLRAHLILAHDLEALSKYTILNKE